MFQKQIAQAARLQEAGLEGMVARDRPRPRCPWGAVGLQTQGRTHVCQQEGLGGQRSNKGLATGFESLRLHRGSKETMGHRHQHNNDLVEWESTELQSKPKVYLGSLGIQIRETQI